MPDINPIIRQNTKIPKTSDILGIAIDFIGWSISVCVIFSATKFITPLINTPKIIDIIPPIPDIAQASPTNIFLTSLRSPPITFMTPISLFLS